MDNKNKEDLKIMKCKPCEGIGKSLTKDKALVLLTRVTHWNISDNGKMIFREYTSKNFISAINLINTIAHVAEEEGHHPDIHLTNYKQFRIELTTHALPGLAENDFIIAAKINEILSI